MNEWDSLSKDGMFIGAMGVGHSTPNAKVVRHLTFSGSFENPILKHSLYHVVQSAQCKSWDFTRTGPDGGVCAKLDDSCSVALGNVKP